MIISDKERFSVVTNRTCVQPTKPHTDSMIAATSPGTHALHFEGKSCWENFALYTAKSPNPHCLTCECRGVYYSVKEYFKCRYDFVNLWDSSSILCVQIVLNVFIQPTPTTKHSSKPYLRIHVNCDDPLNAAPIISKFYFGPTRYITNTNFEEPHKDRLHHTKLMLYIKTICSIPRKCKKFSLCHKS